jgi:Fic-DOC domain mobile mystery protein B
VAGLTEPVPGATPLDENDLAGLVPTWVTTRSDLDALENAGVQRAMLWVFSPRVRYTIEDLLTAAFADRLHKRMFGMVWQWAGQRRQRVTNIGVEPYQITTKLRDVFDDAAYWHTNTAGGFTPVELAARLHHRLVEVHPYTNGNGRHSRLMADAYLHRRGLAQLGWGGLDLNSPTRSRARYIETLRAADAGNYAPLIEFAAAPGTPSDE